VLRIYNPSSITATLDRADFSLYVDGTCIGDGKTSKKYDVPPGDTITITIPFELRS
jgi:LEA14-like dessication related protein